MDRNETRLMESAIALAEELNFSRAARRVGISQPMLSKNIQDLEAILGGTLFTRDRKHVTLSEPGRLYIQHARSSLLYSERAVLEARAAIQNLEAPVYVGRSLYTDPFLISSFLAVQLPLFPRMRIDLVSRFAVDLLHDTLDGSLDLAFMTEPPDTAQITKVQVGLSPLYIAISRRHDLARHQSLTFEQLAGLRWSLFERRLHPLLYDQVVEAAAHKGIKPKDVQNVTAPEEAFPSIADGTSVALLTKSHAILMARNGVTVRPLIEPALQMRSFLISRADNESRLVSELVRAFVRKIENIGRVRQLNLPISI